MRIKKVKVTKDNKITIVYEQRSKSGASWDEYALTCSEMARPAFYVALQDLAHDVLEMCELPGDYMDRIKVRGVSFSYGGAAEVMGATISAAMELKESNQPLNLNTPYKASTSYSDYDADPKQLLSGECIERLELLQDECELYIKGERAQGSLFSVA